MTHNILDFHLRIKAGKFKTLANAAKHALANFDQGQVWFIEDASGEIAAIVHCGSVWTPTLMAQLEDASRQDQ